MKLNVVVLFGGQSSEHEISCLSAKTIMEAMDPKKYNLYPVYVAKDGQWSLYSGDVSKLYMERIPNRTMPAAALLPGAADGKLIIFREQEVIRLNVDVVIPVFHGLMGEDGTIQGLLEIAGIPYVGCGVLASAVAMDKLTTKRLVEPLGIRQARWLEFAASQLLAGTGGAVEQVEKTFSYPVFVKPSRAGSSVGVSKAGNSIELSRGLLEAAQQDRKVMVEEAIVGREVECAVLGNEDPRASGIGEILPAAEFYDYNAKYHNADSKTVIHPDFPQETVARVQDCAVRIFRAIDGAGLARVDFFVEDGTNEVVFNEINTFPGFTSISMYPMLWQAAGMPISELVDELIRLSLSR